MYIRWFFKLNIVGQITNMAFRLKWIKLCHRHRYLLVRCILSSFTISMNDNRISAGVLHWFIRSVGSQKIFIKLYLFILARYECVSNKIKNSRTNLESFLLFKLELNYGITVIKEESYVNPVLNTFHATTPNSC